LNKRTLCRCVRLVIALSIITHFYPRELIAQRYNPSLERQLIREAASQEGRGNLVEAERIVRLILSANPTSDAGLIAAERIFKEQDKLEQILPLIDSYLEVDSDGSVARSLALETYQALGDLKSLKRSAETWLAVDGKRAESYRKVSEVFLEIYGKEEALKILQRGEKTLQSSSQFALTIGDLLVEMERFDSAVIAWAKGIGDDGSQTSAVIRRVVALGEEKQSSIELLLEELIEKPTTIARIRAATRIALEIGLVAEALEFAKVAVVGLEGQARRGFLTVLAKEAQEIKGGEKTAIWAYESMRDQALDQTEIRALNYRIVSASLKIGDMAKALETQYAIAESLPRGNPERRRVLADGLRMGTTREMTEQLLALREFKDEFPDSFEIDELSVQLAVVLDSEGQEALAETLLKGVEGPRSDLERGYLHLINAEIDMGKNSLMTAVSGLPPHQATAVLRLLDIIGRIQGNALEVVIRAAILEHRGYFMESLSELELSLNEIEPLAQPILLSFSARIAQKAGLNEKAAEFRRNIVDHYPESYEFPQASLELARFKGKFESGREEAIVLLENLIIALPSSAIAPLARRELQRLGGK
jgi:tetratricopeptide (TPR) repeat protein